MKRVLGFVLVFMLLFGICAEADAYDDIFMPYKSGKSDVSFSVKFDNAKLLEKLMTQGAYEFGFLDTKLLTESLSGNTGSGVIKFTSDNKYSKIKMSCELTYTLPVRLNTNVSLTGEIRLGYWLDIDLTDAQNPKFVFILSNPFMNKYMKYDITNAMSRDGYDTAEIVSELKGFFNEENINNVKNALADIMRKNSSVSTNGSKAKITFTDKQLSEYIKGVVEYFNTAFAEKSIFSSGTPGGYLTYNTLNGDGLKPFFDENGNSIFAENACTVEIIKDKSGDITECTQTINFAAGNSDDEKINITFSMHADYSMRGGDVKVDMPNLTAENTFDMNQIGFPQNDAWDTDDCLHNEYIYVYSDYIPSDDSNVYINLKELTDFLKVYGYKYKITNEENTVILSETSEKEYFKTAEFGINSDKVTVNGVQIDADKNTVLKDGDLYVDANTLGKLFKLNDDRDILVNLIDNKLSFDVSRKSPQCHHTTEEIFAQPDDDDDYENDGIKWIYTESEMPYNGVMYVGLADVIYQTYYYSEAAASNLVFNNGTVTFTDYTGTEKFHEVSVTNGSDTAVIDGKNFKMNNPAVIYEGHMYVGTELFKELFGYEISDAELSNYSEYGEQSDFLYLTVTLKRQ